MRDSQELVPYKFILDKFQKKSPEEIALTLGILYDEHENIFSLKFMGEQVKLRYPKAEIYYHDNSIISSYLLGTILLRYLVNGTGRKTTGKFITYKEIKDGQVYYPNFYKRTIKRLASIYQKSPEVFHKQYPLQMNIQTYGDLSFSFEFLPNVVFLFIFHEGDEEFPASANVLMDSNTEDYFDAEDLAVVVDVAIEYFVNSGRVPVDMGMY